MRRTEPLDLYWDLAQVEAPILTHDDLVRLPCPVREGWQRADLLRPVEPATSLECTGCDLGHVSEVFWEHYTDGRLRPYIHCPDCGHTEVDPERLRQWRPDYGAVAAAIAEALQSRGARQSLVPDRLWQLGRAALAGQSRPVWLARRISDELRLRLPSDRISILFVLGRRPAGGLDLDDDRVFEVRHLVALADGRLRLDVEAVHGPLRKMVREAPPKQRAPRKDARRALAIKAAKRELHAHILSMKGLLAHGHSRLPRLTQKALAERIGETPSTISRILNHEHDELLKILWDTANREEAIRSYARTRG